MAGWEEIPGTRCGSSHIDAAVIEKIMNDIKDRRRERSSIVCQISLHESQHHGLLCNTTQRDSALVAFQERHEIHRFFLHVHLTEQLLFNIRVTKNT